MRYSASFCNLESNSSIQLPKPVNGMWIILLYCHSNEFPREIPISTLFTRWFVHWSISPLWFYKNFNHFIIFWNKQKDKIELHRYQVVIIWLLHENAFFIFGLNQMQTRGGIESNQFRIELLSNFLNNSSPFESIGL